MEQEDYIKRQIDQLGRALGKILADLIGLKTGGEMSEGIEEADQALKNALNLKIDDLISIPAEKFVQTLQEAGKLNNDNLTILADLLLLIAEELDQNEPENEKIKNLYMRSLTIYEHIDKTSSTFSFERHYKIEKINNAGNASNASNADNADNANNADNAGNAGNAGNANN